MAPDIICPAENHLNPPATWEGSFKGGEEKEDLQDAEVRRGP
jgi:hypothetical protein